MFYLYQFLLVIFLVVLNGFFVLAEFAIVKVRASQIETLDTSYIPAAISKNAKHILRHVDSYLACCQLGITIASLALGWVGEAVVHQALLKMFTTMQFQISPTLLSSIAVFSAFLLITIMHIVFGELIPKTLAINHPVDSTLTVAWPLHGCYILLRPFIWLFNGLAALLVKPFNFVKDKSSNVSYSEDELKAIIVDSQQSGAIAESEVQLIKNAFAFDNRKVNKILTHRQDVVAIELHSTLAQATHIAIESGHSRFPVYDTKMDNIVGIIYTKVLSCEFLRYADPSQKTISELVVEPLFIAENSKVTYALKKLQQKHLQMAIVTNEVGEFCGLITFEDIIEELVGEVQDEDDEEDWIVKALSDGVYLVDAHSSISDINKYLVPELPESNSYSTLAGLIVELYPEHEISLNSQLVIYAYTGKVLKMHRNSVELIQLSLTKD